MIIKKYLLNTYPSTNLDPPPILFLKYLITLRENLSVHCHTVSNWPIIVSLPIQQYDVLSTIKLSGWRSQLKTFKTLANAVFRTWRHGGPENPLHAIYLPNIFPREHFLLRASRSHFLRALEPHHWPYSWFTHLSRKLKWLSDLQHSRFLFGFYVWFLCISINDTLWYVDKWYDMMQYDMAWYVFIMTWYDLCLHCWLNIPSETMQRITYTAQEQETQFFVFFIVIVVVVSVVVVVIVTE